MKQPLLAWAAVGTLAVALPTAVAVAGAGTAHRPAPPATPAAGAPATAPTATSAATAPHVAQFASVPRFWCLPAHPGQAQTTIGWSVPTATSATVLLDGRALHQGIRKQLPFAVMAGKPAGIGVTVVFACRPGDHHRITIRWRDGSSPASARTVRIRKAT